MDVLDIRLLVDYTPAVLLHLVQDGQMWKADVNQLLATTGKLSTYLANLLFYFFTRLPNIPKPVKHGKYSVLRNLLIK